MDIPALVSAGEGQRTEFKSSFASQNEIIDSLGAMANADGGIVLVGLKNEGSLVGAQIGDNTLENFANRLAANSDPHLFVSIETEQIEDKKIVAISVGPARQSEVFYTFGRP